MDALDALLRFIEAKEALYHAEQNFNAGKMLTALNLAYKAKRLVPKLDGLAALLQCYHIHSAFDPKSPDWYAVLNVKRGDDIDLIRKRFKYLRAITNPDNNTCAAAEGALKLVYKAWEAICRDVKGGTSGSKNDAKEEEERKLCPDCSRQCVSIDSRGAVFECKSCKIIVMSGGKEEGVLMVIRDGFASIDIKGELNSKIDVCGGNITVEGVNGVYVYGGASVHVNQCKGVELKGGDGILHMNNCKQISINGSGINMGS